MWIDKYLDDYCAWIRDNTQSQVDEQTGWATISTPYFGLFNDGIDLFAKTTGDTITLSDDGATISNLELSGVTIVKTRKIFVQNILTNYGIKLNEATKELTTTATPSTFAERKHALLSAIIQISDLDTLATHNVSATFADDVRAYLESLGQIITPGFIAKGATGLEFSFDFQIARHSSEIVIQTFNTLRQNSLASFLFGWQDIKQTREQQTGKHLKGLAIINNTPDEKYLEALQQRNADFILWDERNSERSKSILTAA